MLGVAEHATPRLARGGARVRGCSPVTSRSLGRAHPVALLVVGAARWAHSAPKVTCCPGLLCPAADPVQGEGALDRAITLFIFLVCCKLAWGRRPGPRHGGRKYAWLLSACFQIPLFGIMSSDSADLFLLDESDPRLQQR